MPIYRLQPIDTGKRSWRSSTWRGTVIVRAASEKQARNLARAAFIVSTRSRVGEELLETPWRDETLVSCLEMRNSGYAEDGGGAVLHPPAGSSSPRL